jgi:hypothetical protein
MPAHIRPSLRTAGRRGIQDRSLGDATCPRVSLAPVAAAAAGSGAAGSGRWPSWARSFAFLGAIDLEPHDSARSRPCRGRRISHQLFAAAAPPCPPAANGNGGWLLTKSERGRFSWLGAGAFAAPAGGVSVTEPSSVTNATDFAPNEGPGEWQLSCCEQGGGRDAGYCITPAVVIRAACWGAPR